GTALRGDPATDTDDSGSGAVLIGYGTKERKRSARAVPTGRFGKRKGVAEGPEAEAPAAAVSVAGSGSADAPRVSPVVSPLVRKLARDHGFEAHTLAGTGPEGLVLRADVERRISSGAAPQASTPQTPVAAGEGDTRIPLTGLRRVVAERMAA